jgi:vacuolar protein sorting-associated protein 13A/C
MDLHVVRQPQDGTADLQVTVKLAPSYVTYKQAAIAEVQKFFSSGEQQLELSALQAQAAARADKLRRMAQTQLNAMSKRNAAQKPRLQLKMTLNAPKIAIPSEWVIQVQLCPALVHPRQAVRPSVTQCVICI